MSTKYSESQLKLRRKYLKFFLKNMDMKIIIKQFMNVLMSGLKSIISAGVVDYYNAYNKSFINKSLDKRKCKKL
jgi:hypothetical protein